MPHDASDNLIREEAEKYLDSLTLDQIRDGLIADLSARRVDRTWRTSPKDEG